MIFCIEFGRFDMDRKLHVETTPKNKVNRRHEVAGNVREPLGTSEHLPWLQIQRVRFLQAFQLPLKSIVSYNVSAFDSYEKQILVLNVFYTTYSYVQ